MFEEVEYKPWFCSFLLFVSLIHSIKESPLYPKQLKYVPGSVRITYHSTNEIYRTSELPRVQNLNENTAFALLVRIDS